MIFFVLVEIGVLTSIILAILKGEAFISVPLQLIINVSGEDD